MRLALFLAMSLWDLRVCRNGERPHLMFYVPQTDGATRGSDVTDSPVYLNPQFQGAPEPVTVFMVPVGKWSDGTAAPLM
jgi:hypothetical protein